MKFIWISLLVFSLEFARAQNQVYTFAGTGTAGLVNGMTSTSQFHAPHGICRDLKGNFYVADGLNHCIRKIDSIGIVSTYAGTAVAGFRDGPLAIAQFNEPFSLCVDTAGNLYVSDFANQRIRLISNTGLVSTIAGSGVEGFRDGQGPLALFDYPRGITRDASGNLYVADSWNHRIRRIDISTLEVSTYAGGGTITGVGTNAGYVDAPDTAARFHTPTGVSFDRSGNLFVADALNHRIRVIDSLRVVTTFAGSGNGGSFADGPASSARFNTPTDLFWCSNGTLLIGDTYNNRVRIVSGGSVSTLAGNGTPGFLNGPDVSAEFNYPRSLTASETADSVWVVDDNNHAVRLIAGAAVGIREQKKSMISISPNPAHHRVKIEYKNQNLQPRHAKIKLTDVSGCNVSTFNPTGYVANTFELNTASLNPGIYWVQLFIENELLETEKLIVQ